MSEMLCETWWKKLSEGTLQAAEQAGWEAHLGTCAACAREWAAWQRLETALRWAPRVPALPADFALRTTATLAARRRRYPHWVQGVAMLVFALLSTWVWLLVLAPTVLRLAFWLHVARWFGFELVQGVLALGQLWQSWRGFLIPFGGLLIMVVVLGVMLPVIAACASGLVVYVQRGYREVR